VIGSQGNAGPRSVVLFDIDGTLIRNAGAHHKNALVAGIERVTGLSTTLDGVATSGMLDRDLIAAMMRAGGASERRISAAMRRIVDECQDVYLRACAADLRERLCPGILPFLSELHGRGALIGAVTGNLSQIGWKKLELAGLREFFIVGAFAQDGTTRTRLARVAVQRAKKAGLIARSSRISLVGDHMNDIEAAKANQFQSVAVATGVTPYEQLQASRPDILVRDVTELDPKDLV